jgi:hypothetical protein
LLSGVIVGGGVWLGSGRRGGRGYQWLGILLTYYSIGASYGLIAAREYIRNPAAFETPPPASMPSPGSFDAAPPNSDPARSDTPAAPGTTSMPTTSAGVAREEAEAPLTAGQVIGAVLFLLIAPMVLPVLTAIAAPTMIVIVLVSLYEAWKINQRRPESA